jgi:phenylalanyl-tRNA synthetase beta subunit
MDDMKLLGKSEDNLQNKIKIVKAHNKTGSREVHMTTTQIENTATCPDKVVTKATRRRVALHQKQPLKMVKSIDRNT